MTIDVHIDFETRSAADLPKVGSDIYSRHPSTDMLCLGFQFGDEEPNFITRRDPLPSRLQDHILEGGKLIAHNASFELAIWNNVCFQKYNWPTISLEQTFCTMAQAYAMALPGTLEKAAAAAGITEQKDMGGSRVMKQISKPRDILPDGTIVWWNEEEFSDKYEALYQYCLQDVRVEHQLYKRLLQLTERERKVWLLDQTINSRGVQIDVAAAKKAIKIVESEAERLDQKMRDVTQKGVGACTNSVQLANWMREQGVENEGVAKPALLKLLTQELPNHVRQALLLRQEAAKSSTAKLIPMIDCADESNRVKGMFQYHGAGTGRWAGRKIQFQNLPRPQLMKPDDVEFFLSNIDKFQNPDLIELSYGSPLQVISDSIRGFITAKPNHRLVAADFAAIEARVLAWLAGEEKVLHIFRTHGKIYEHAAAGIYHVPAESVTKDQRQIGKVAILALGFQGGVGAFQQMAKGYGVRVSDNEADTIKLKWRDDNPNIVKYWYALEEAALAAVRNPGKAYYVGQEGRRVAFIVKGSFLFCQLPSKRMNCYPYPKIESVETPWGQEKEAVTYMSEDSTSRQWKRHKTYGGFWAENITQGTARDVLVDAMFRVEAKGYPIIIHIHDEAVAEVPNGFGTLKEFEQIMSEVPEWAKDLPIAVEGYEAMRFRKD